MIQRVQSIYLILSMISLTILLSGMNLIVFSGQKYMASLNVFGINKIELLKNQTVSDSSYPIYLSIIGLVLYIFILLMRYKNLPLQLKMIRRLFFMYFLIVLAFLLFSVYGSQVIGEKEISSQIGWGFVFFILPFPFIFLAQIAIKRDKQLLDSLNRLR